MKKVVLHTFRRTGVSVARRDVSVLQLNYNNVRYARNMLSKYRKCRKKQNGLKYGGGGVPSSGLVAILGLITLCDEVRTLALTLTVYGMGRASGYDYQYYKLANTHRSKGNPVHSFDAETALVKDLARLKALTFNTLEGYVYGPKTTNYELPEEEKLPEFSKWWMVI
eukprot:scaffold100_cov357-Prasinococcus_capsulatus_cf.AAC.21